MKIESQGFLSEVKCKKNKIKIGVRKFRMNSEGEIQFRWTKHAQGRHHQNWITWGRILKANSEFTFAVSGSKNKAYWTSEVILFVHDCMEDVRDQYEELFS